ncbi:MAG: hypothetical protein AAF502_01045 [Bacteroidota bacterium]
MRTTLMTFGGILVVIIALLFGMRALSGNQQSSQPPGKKTVIAPQQARTLPAPPENLLNAIFDQADFIDFIFYNLNYSMSISEPESVRGAVAYMTMEAVPNLDCVPSMGKIFYKSDGETILEADLHFSPGCSYIILLNEQRQQAYACNISENGLRNLGNMIGNVGTKPQ